MDISNVKQIKTIAVIEIVLKQRIKLKDEKELMIQDHVNLGMNESYQKMLETFSQLIRAALSIVEKKKK